MWRRQSFLKWKVLLISFILNTFVRRTSSENSTCEYKFESVEVLNGQDVSVGFHLKVPLLEFQTLMWVAPHTSWSMNCNSSLQCTSNESSISTRYKLTESFQNYTFEVLIRPAQDEDSGQHFIVLYEGTESKCTAMIFYLTVVEISNSTCITRLDRKKEKIELSCQWTQVSNNEHAEFLAGNHLLLEDRNPDRMLNGNLTHESSVHIDIEAMVDVDYVCVVFHGKSNESKRCDFPTPQHHLVKYNQRVERQLNCCVTNVNTSVTWWNNASVEVLPSSFHNMNNYILFLCLENNDSPKTKIHSIDILDLTEFEGDHNLTLGKSPSKQHIDSTDELRCQTISVNITLGLRPTTDGSTEGNSILSTSNFKQSIQSTIQSNNAEHVMVISVAVVSMCLVFSIAINFFVLRFYNFLRKNKYRVREQSSTDALTSLAAAEDNVDDSRSHEMTTFSSLTPRPSTDTNVRSATIDTSLLDREAIQSSYEDRAKPRTRQVVCDTEESFPANKISTCNSYPIVKGFVQGEGTGNGCTDGSDAKRVIDHPVSMTPYIDNAYSSVADVKGATRFTKTANQSSMLSTVLCPLQSSEDHDGEGLDVPKIETPPSLTDKARRSSGDSVLRSTNRPAAELEAMYAQPDMTRKTKNMGNLSESIPQSSQYPHRVSHHVCGKGPSDLTEDVRQNNVSARDHFYSLVPTDDHTGHLCGDGDADRITESTCGAELYMNSCVHRFE